MMAGKSADAVINDKVVAKADAVCETRVDGVANETLDQAGKKATDEKAAPKIAKAKQRFNLDPAKIDLRQVKKRLDRNSRK